MQVNIDDAKEGMVLAEDVLLPNGTVLVNATYVLSARTIEILKRRGIQKVQVLTEQAPVHDASQAAQDQLAPALPQRPEPLPETDDQPPVPTFPSVTVSIAADQMSASIHVESAGKAFEHLTLNHVRTVLEERGVAYGIDEKKLSECVDKWNQARKPFDMREIARGVMPAPGREGELDLRVAHISDVARLDEVRKATHWWQIADGGAGLDRVDPGTVVARRRLGAPPIPGKTVTDELISCQEVVRLPLQLDPTVQFAGEGNEVVAGQSGVCFFTNGAIGVVPLSFDGTAEIAADPLRIRAEMIIHPCGPGGTYPSEGQIRRLLTDNGICWGVREDVLGGLIAACVKKAPPLEPVTIAVGSPPQPGEDGRVEYLFNTDTSLKPKTNPDGSVDFKSLDIVHYVSKGAALARLVAPTMGTAGRDITGREVPCTNGKAARLPAGANTAPSAETPDVLIATADGNVSFAGSNVDVHEGFVIRGDIDFSTGNVKYDKSVVVSGDVKSGFTVECGGDLEVSGTIEDSRISVGGNLLCKHGFVGQGKGVVEARGDVNIGFMKNQTVRSRKNIVVAKEALNCTLCARLSIAVHGNPLSVAGGSLVARDSITVHTVGNASQIRTNLEVGLDFALADELKKTDSQIEEITANRRKLAEPVTKFEHLLKIRKGLPPKEEFLFAKLKNALSRYDQQLRELEARKQTVRSKMVVTEHAFVKIEHAAMPGTVIKIGDRYLLVKDEIVGPKSVRLIREQIRIL